jgi:OFA family oxalate/formate antiporter-like MFS transporter
MVAIANLQYGWTLFINPIDQKHGWGTAALQWTFTIAIATETVVPALGGGRLVDRFGPRLIWVSGPLIAIAWYINSIADALILFYVDAVISGVGVGLIFAAANGNALKWFPDRRGLAIGLTAAGFAGGGAVTVVPLASMIPIQRLRGRVSVVRDRPGARRSGDRAAAAGAAAGRGRRTRVGAGAARPL